MVTSDPFDFAVAYRDVPGLFGEFGAFVNRGDAEIFAERLGGDDIEVREHEKLSPSRIEYSPISTRT